MAIFEKRSFVPISRDALYAYHANPGALERLIPPWQPVRVIQNEGPLADGKRVVLEMKIGPIWKRWVAEHFDTVPGERFRDRQVKGPFKRWTHTHEFKDAASGSMLTDRVEYELPLGPLGAGHVHRQLERMFAFRHRRTRHDVERHARFADRPRQQIAMTGASGAIASNLIPFLTTAGHRVARMRRSGAGEDDIAWNAATGEVDRERFAACDTIVHLAGKPIMTRWTAAAKDELWKSRVGATRGLCETLAKMPRRPGVLVAASAVGFYGNRGDTQLDETDVRGDGFAAEMCEAWERATTPAREAGIRVVNVRVGVVLSANTGALRQLLMPTKLGLAGRVGSGQQWMPWIAMEDIVGVFHEALFRDDWSGVINGVAGSVRQIDFIRTLGRVLHRPTILPLPTFAVRTLFGQMGDELLLASANVQPTRLRDLGLEWTLPQLEDALRFELGATTPSPP